MTNLQGPWTGDDESLKDRLAAFAREHLAALVAGEMRVVRETYDDRARIFLLQEGETVVATAGDIAEMALENAQRRPDPVDALVKVHAVHVRRGFGMVDVGFTRADGVRVRGFYTGYITPEGPRIVTGLIRHAEPETDA